MAITFAPAPIQRQQPYVDPNDIASRQALAEALSQQAGGIQQIKSPWQGLAQVSDSIFGALGEKKAAADKAQNAKVLAEILSGTASGQPISSDRLNIVMALDPEAGMAIAKDQQAKAEDAAARSRTADALAAQGLTQQAEAVRSGALSAQDGASLLEQSYAPQKPDIREVGGSLVQVGPDGTAKPIYTAPDNSAAKVPTSYQEYQLAKSDPGYAASLSSSSTKPPTTDQSNAGTFADRMLAAEQVLEQTEGVQTDQGQALLNMTPGAGNYLISPEYRQAQQAQRDFVNAVLRKESGAAISDSEFENARKQYFPQPGDDPATIAQKRQNRAIAIAGMKRAAGPIYGRAQEMQDGTIQAPATGTIMDGYRFKGGDPADPNSWEQVQ